MHDYDRIQAEYETLVPELEGEYEYEYETPGEWEWEGEGEGEGAYGRHRGDSPFTEGQEMELAAELLDVRNEQELDHFLGDLIKKVGSAVGSVVKSPIGQALGGVLKKVAKTALPIAGSALGTFIGGPAGGMIGGKLASAAGNMFGLELEGLSGEDREFEVARRFVRFAGSAARRAAHSPRGMHPRQAARAAIMAAARRHAPGLLSKMGGGRPGVPRPQSPRAGAQAYAGASGASATPDGDGFSSYDPDAADDDSSAGDQDGDGDGYGDADGTMPAGARRRGTWIRRGRRIILFGA